MNSVNVIGRLVRDPEEKQTNSGTVLATFSIAVDGRKDEVSYFDCKAFGKTAELVLQYKHKGEQVGISGRLVQERWNKDGDKRSAVRIIAENVTFIGPKAEYDHPGAFDRAKETAKTEQTFSEAAGDDDIPF